MAGRLRQRAFLTPSGHAAIDEARVTCQHDVRAESQPLHHAGTKALDQRVGMFKQIKHLSDRGLVLEVDFDNLSSAPGRRFKILSGPDAIERHHLRAHIRQHHACKGSGTDAGEFDDTETREWTGGAGGGLWGRFIEQFVFPLIRER